VFSVPFQSAFHLVKRAGISSSQKFEILVEILANIPVNNN
jgi:hypothetical protein